MSREIENNGDANDAQRDDRLSSDWENVKWASTERTPLPLPKSQVTHDETGHKEVATGQIRIRSHAAVTTEAGDSEDDNHTGDNERPRGFIGVVSRINGVLLPVLLCVCGIISVENVDASKAEALGIVNLMPPIYFLIVGLLATSFLLRLRRRYLDQVALTFHIIALIFLLHGIISVIEDFPRFPVAFTHQGLVEYIQRNNATLPSLEARMNWPAFFILSAILQNLAGLKDLIPFLLWAPLANNLMVAPAVFALTRSLSKDRRVPWLALWIYFSASWVGQDYFAPQAVNIVLFLAFMTLIVRFFRTDYTPYPRIVQAVFDRLRPVLRKLTSHNELVPGAAPVTPTIPGQRVALVGALVVIYAASVMSHQLTPVFLLIEMLAIVFLRRTALRGFHTLMLVFFFGYISFGAIGYWEGNLSAMFGGAGQISGTIDENVGNKVKADTVHTYVIYARLLFSAFIWSLALGGLLRRLRVGRSDTIATIGFLAPFSILLVQSYDGEVILRVFVFALPFAALLVAFTLFPTEQTKFSIRGVIASCCIATLMIPVFFLTRFGNEQFEYISPKEYAGIVKMYEIIPRDATLIGISGDTAWRIKDFESHDLARIEESVLQQGDVRRALDESVRMNLNKEPYVVVSRSMTRSLALQTGREPEWGTPFVQELLNSKQYVLVYQNSDFTLLRPINATRSELKVK